MIGINYAEDGERKPALSKAPMEIPNARCAEKHKRVTSTLSEAVVGGRRSRGRLQLLINLIPIVEFKTLSA